MPLALEAIGGQHTGMEPLPHGFVRHVQMFCECRHGKVDVGMRREVADAAFSHSGATGKKGCTSADFSDRNCAFLPYLNRHQIRSGCHERGPTVSSVYLTAQR